VKGDVESLSSCNVHWVACDAPVRRAGDGDGIEFQRPCNSVVSCAYANRKPTAKN